MRDEIYILYSKKQRHYFPDFLVIDENDIHWLVEIKDDNNPNPEIEEKNQAAKEWVNALNLELGEEARKTEKWRFLYNPTQKKCQTRELKFYEKK